MFKAIGDALESLYRTVMPGFWLALKPRYQWAGAIALIVAIWVATGRAHQPRDAEGRRRRGQ